MWVQSRNQRSWLMIIAQPANSSFTTKLGQGGSGLGLHIVYNLVQELLGGRIQVDNTPDSGACFTLLLPLEAPA